MRKFILSIALALLLVGAVSVSSADAQWRRGWSSYYYSYPAYSYPAYSYPTYSYPSYSYYYTPDNSIYYYSAPDYYYGSSYYSYPRYYRWRWR